MAKDIYLGLGSEFFIDNSIFIHPLHEIIIDTEFGVMTFYKLLPFFFTISFSIIAILFIEFLPDILNSFKLSRLGYFTFGFFSQRFLIELLYNNYIVNFILNLGGQTTKIMDKGSIELIGPYGLEKALVSLSKTITTFNTSIVTTYALYILIGLSSYLFSIMFGETNINIILLIILSFTIIVSKNN
jgi:NADH-ubiquinone oxidoreductase chain 5